MVRRSVLFSPGDRPEMLRKATETDADVVVFDLEDAVAPERKDEGREAIRAALNDDGFETDAEVCVRVNADRDAIGDDLDGVLGGDAAPDSLMLPKAESAEAVRSLRYDLAEYGADDLPVLAVVETARGVLRAEAIADADPTDAVLFGAEDLAAEVGATRTRGGEEVLYARERVVLAAAAAGVDAVDTLFTDVADVDGLREDAAFARQLGYDGKMAVHPDQVGPINDAYTPGEERVEWARKVLAARDEAAAEGRGVFRVDDEMIDAPLVAQAEGVLELARAAGVVDDADGPPDGDGDHPDR
jgi:citrate lyase subunit beta/citryl-CoA lyase